MPKSLPPKPSIKNLRNQAKTLLKAHKNGNSTVCETFRLIHRFHGLPDHEILQASVSLQETQYALALEYGFKGWKELKEHIENEQLDMVQYRGIRQRLKQIHAYGRPKQRELTPVELKRIITEALEHLRSFIPSTVEIRYKISKDIGVIMGNPIQITQLLLNLCGNSSNAMQDSGGVLDVLLTRVILDADNVSSPYAGLPVGNYVKLRITDTGQFIGPLQLPQIFASTKEKIDEGPEMGFAMAHAIVKQHNGFIQAESQFDKGTTFEILFPLVESESIAETEGTAIKA